MKDFQHLGAAVENKRIKVGGVRAKGKRRIQFDFVLDGVRYRPTLVRIPTEANLQRSREQLKAIKERILIGTFCFEEEFPDFRHLNRVIDPSQIRTCDQVFDQFIEHCEARLRRDDLAHITVSSYRRILNHIWRPKLGSKLSLRVDYLTLSRIADGNRRWSKKRFNNAISVLRRTFAFGYQNHPQQMNPAFGLKCGRMARKDRPRPDPFRIQDAEALISAIHADWGEAQGNYDEFRFFTGLRPSEQIALTVDDFDAARGTLSVNKARVEGVHKNSTKTRQDRLFELCPRALGVLQRQLQLRERLHLTGRVDHDRLFVMENGRPIQDITEPARRWRQSLSRLQIRRRRPYCARHSSVSWNLMIGKNPLWVARQHGHGVRTMLEVYAAWAEGAVESDIEFIRRAMGWMSLAIPADTESIPGVHQGSAIHHERLSGASFSVWHWIRHQQRGACI